MDNQEPAVAIRREIVSQEINLWNNTLYLARVRHRAQKAVGASEARLVEFEGEVERAIKMLDAYTAILLEINEEDAAAKKAKEQQAVDALAPRNGRKEPVAEKG